MDYLNKRINEFLESHKGGELFFDRIDDEIRNNIPEFYYWKLLNLLPKCTLVLTGAFGLSFLNRMRARNLPEYPFIWFNGSIRKGNLPKILEQSKDTFSPYIMLDDSYYSGRTLTSIQNELSCHGILITKCVVFYDGSYKKNPEVQSLFRYYDIFFT